MEKIVELKNINFGYNSKYYTIRNINFDVYRGDFISIIGSNGIGKSTILKLILGEEKIDSGEIRLFGENIKKFRQWKKIGYLEQNAYYKVLNFPATVYEIVMSNMFSSIGLFKRPNKNHHKKVIETLELLNIEKIKNKMISKLSGGQIQKVFLARTLVQNPELLILDEPTTAIDSEATSVIYDILKDLNKKENMTIIMVTHDLKYVSLISSKILCFEEGSLIELDKKQLDIELSYKHKHNGKDCCSI